jgi:pyruvate/2-oxoglutarate dehydrogenase complex dihydrolipoamide dehydrogenase (E3) component
VPSKALLASAKAAHTIRHADAYGLTAAPPEIDTARVWARIHAIQREIAGTDDDPERFRAAGVDVLLGAARLTSPTTVQVGDDEHTARYILLATGSRPATPPIDGLADAGFLTSEAIFELDRPPTSLVMIGGWPINIDLAQVLTRLGVRVTVLEQAPRILPREEPALADRLLGILRAEGVEVELGVQVDRVSVLETGSKTVHAGERAWTAWGSKRSG